MSRTLSPSALSSVFAQQTENAFILLLTIDHPTYAEPIRICSDPYEVLPMAGVRGIISRGIEYVFLPFEFQLPNSDDTGLSRARLSIDNVDRQIVAAVRTADSAISIGMEIVTSRDPDVVEVSMQGFKLDNIEYNAMRVNGDISMEYFDLEPFPAGRFTPSDFPGLF